MIPSENGPDPCDEAHFVTDFAGFGLWADLLDPITVANHYDNLSDTRRGIERWLARAIDYALRTKQFGLMLTITNHARWAYQNDHLIIPTTVRGTELDTENVRSHPSLARDEHRLARAGLTTYWPSEDGTESHVRLRLPRYPTPPTQAHRLALLAALWMQDDASGHAFVYGWAWDADGRHKIGHSASVAKVAVALYMATEPLSNAALARLAMVAATTAGTHRPVAEAMADGVAGMVLRGRSEGLSLPTTVSPLDGLQPTLQPSDPDPDSAPLDGLQLTDPDPDSAPSYTPSPIDMILSRPLGNDSRVAREIERAHLSGDTTEAQHNPCLAKVLSHRLRIFTQRDHYRTPHPVTGQSPAERDQARYHAKTMNNFQHQRFMESQADCVGVTDEPDDRVEITNTFTPPEPDPPKSDEYLEDVQAAQTLVDATIMGGPADGLTVQIPQLSLKYGMVGLTVDSQPAVAQIAQGSQGPTLLWNSVRIVATRKG